MSSNKYTNNPQKSSHFSNFATAGLGGIAGWVVVHPANTLAVQMNLATLSSGKPPGSFYQFSKKLIESRGIKSLYDGLDAGIIRQVVYATSRIGLFEVYRDELAKYRNTDFFSRLLVGCLSGGSAALLSCPAEVTLVRIANDKAQPENLRRNYKNVSNAFTRILQEEGWRTFFSGSSAFVNRAMLVGAVQVGTYDQFRSSYARYGISYSSASNVFCAAMSSGLLYSLITMPFESAKNRMAFQKPVNGVLIYKGSIQTIQLVAKTDGILSLWNGFLPYYMRCGGHTIVMFMCMEWLRKIL